MKMVKKNWLLVVLIGVLILIVGTGLLAKFGMERAAAKEILTKFPDRGVPRMNITLNGVTLDEINAGSKDVKYEGNEVAVYEGEEKTLEAEGVRVKGRGNATWEWIPDKKPYKIKFKKKVDLFGLGKAKKWNLLANHMDDSNLRNDTAFYIANMLGMEYAYSGKYVELYVDGEYRGLYYLTRGVEISNTTVDLRNPLGILVELDNIYGELEEYSARTINDDVMAVKDVVSEDNVKMAFDSFMDAFNIFESALNESDFEKIAEVIDVESFAKYYLLSEFTVNPDAYWTSFYFYKDGVNDKIHAGPGWDYDFALANRGWVNWLGERFYSPTESMIRKEELKPLEFYLDNGLSVEQYKNSTNISDIIYRLMEMREFRIVVNAIYNDALLGKKMSLLNHLNDRKNEISKAAHANEEVWGKNTFETEAARLTDWIERRYDYMDETFRLSEMDIVEGLKEITEDDILELGEL